MSDEPILEICDLSVDVGGQPYVRDLSLRVKRGQFHGLLGPNGADAHGPHGSTVRRRQPYRSCVFRIAESEKVPDASAMARDILYVCPFRQ